MANMGKYTVSFKNKVYISEQSDHIAVNVQSNASETVSFLLKIYQSQQWRSDGFDIGFRNLHHG